MKTITDDNSGGYKSIVVNGYTVNYKAITQPWVTI